MADVYAGCGPARASLFNYALFATWFPHVVAGPIIHWREMMPQFEKLGQRTGALLRSPMHRENICRALSLFGIGIAKKRWFAEAVGPGAVETHRRLKAALDPLGILNPGKFV